MDNVKFISYDGEYPCLCMGTLKIKVKEVIYSLEDCLISGGTVSFDEDYDDEIIETGDWNIDLSSHPELNKYRKEILKVVNKNVSQGCCGGCL